jgi:fatty acid desaturase
VSAQASRSSVVRRRSRTIEWPSVLLCAGIYGGYGAVTFFHAALPLPAVAILGALLVAWHSSMQHEFIHGHPTPWRRVNRLLAAPPLCLWLPFESYRMSHLVHHCDEALTDPLDDPESYYWSAADWAAIGPLGRLVVRAHTTLAGRLVIGPFWNIGRYWLGESRAVRRGDRVRRRIWAWHLLGVAATLLWVVGICHMSLAFYLFGIVYPATAVLLLRSFAEHRAEAGVFERTAIVENSWFFGPLFLFNNLHAAHHERPLIPWYELPAWYRANRGRLIAANRGLVYEGYGEVARRFLFTPHHVIVHPLGEGDLEDARSLSAPRRA